MTLAANGTISEEQLNDLTKEIDNKAAIINNNDQREQQIVLLRNKMAADRKQKMEDAKQRLDRERLQVS